MTTRTVLVTGASSGFGLATAIAARRAGFAVVGAVPDDDGAAALERAAVRDGVTVDIRKADLAEPPQRARLLHGLELYAVVNNAGYLNAGLLDDVPLEEARRQLEVMVLAPVDLARRALPHMLRRGEGRIVNVTSAAVHTSTPVSGWYQACKAALRELTDALRLELATTGVDVVDLEPGGFATGIWPRAADELRRRQAVSDRPRAYDRPLSAVERYQDRMGDPTAVADNIVTALTSSRVRNHRRVGHDALPLRIAADVLPDRIWDRISSGLAGVR